MIYHVVNQDVSGSDMYTVGPSHSSQVVLTAGSENQIKISKIFTSILTLFINKYTSPKTKAPNY